MKITRDTLARKMDLNIAEGSIREQSATFNNDGTIKELRLNVGDGEKFNYNVTMTRKELWPVLDGYLEKNATCPF